MYALRISPTVRLTVSSPPVRENKLVLANAVRSRPAVANRFRTETFRNGMPKHGQISTVRVRVLALCRVGFVGAPGGL